MSTIEVRDDNDSITLVVTTTQGECGLSPSTDGSTTDAANASAVMKPGDFVIAPLCYADGVHLTRGQVVAILKSTVRVSFRKRDGSLFSPNELRMSI